jgi:3-dehydroquinate synthase
VALGGGVIGDITGFAAAVALRGLDFVQIPTTLLAQVDSSVGGKTGINTRHGKNLIGAFHQPRLVLADTGILDTLPERELLAGYAEVVKYGLLGDKDFFTWLEGHGAAVRDGDPEARRHAVVRSCRAKATIVVADERETGQRALLNLGHTFGHALEAETGFGDALLHGEGVAIGMVLAFDLSVQLGHCAAVDADLARRHLAAIGLPTSPAHALGNIWSAEALIGHMAKDKKVADGKMTFVLAHGIGDAFLSQGVTRDDLLALFEGAMLQ